MQTTKQLLPAINNLYDLGLTDSEMQKLTGAFDFANKFTGQQLVEGTDQFLNRLFYVLIKPDLYLSSVFASNNIQIHKLPKNSDGTSEQPENYPSLLQWGAGFTYSSSKYFSRTAVLDGAFCFETAVTESHYEDLLQLTFLIDSLAARKLRRRLYTDSKICNPMILVHGPGEAITTLRGTVDENLEEFSRDLSDDRTEWADLEKLLAQLTSIWPEMKITKETLTDEAINRLRRTSGLIKTVFVGEWDNKRLFIQVSNGKRWSYWSGERLTLSWGILPHTHGAYDYCDVGRTCYSNDRSITRFSTCFGQKIFFEEEPVIPSSQVIEEEWGNGDSDAVELVSNQQATLVAKRYTQRLIREKREHEAEQLLRDKTQEKIATVKHLGKTLKINEVVYTKQSVTYQGQTLTITKSNTEFWCNTLLTRLASAHGISGILFDNAIEYFVMAVASQAAPGNEVEGKIGDVKFKLTVKTSTSMRQNGPVTSSRLYLNGYRINTDEIEKCLERALCFTTQESFDGFLASVSKCSLYIHKYLQLGIDVVVKDNFDNTVITMKFPLERRKGINYLVLGQNEFRVSNTNRLIRLRNASDILSVVNTLLNGDTVLNVAAVDIKAIIVAGKRAYVDAVEKSKELLANTEKVFSLAASTFTINGTQKHGYKIPGKMRTYFLENNVELDERRSCGVYDFNTGQYICIVDKSTSQVGMDKLVNRIYALHNDTLVANQISTLK
ncbi:MAG: hypothetical protein H8E12_17035 [Rhodobacteraceae bacterium]|nr:hypothetical protein [Paracoccaceae bacterium]